jgi:hypothetical protein
LNTNVSSPNGRLSVTPFFERQYSRRVSISMVVDQRIKIIEQGDKIQNQSNKLKSSPQTTSKWIIVSTRFENSMLIQSHLTPL